MSIELKIKSKHLSLEAKVIRFEEQKLQKQIQWHTSREKKQAWEIKDAWPLCLKIGSLTSHRKYDVRNENRSTFLARAYLAGQSYNKVENKRKPEKEGTFELVVLPRVLKMVQKYGGRKTRELTLDKLKEWCYN